MAKICKEMKEQKSDLIEKSVLVIGISVAQDLVKQTWRIENSGGMKMVDSDKRRSHGGVFLHLVKK